MNNQRLYHMLQSKNRRAKQIERSRSSKDAHGHSGSSHQRNKKLAEIRRNEAVDL